MAPDNRPTPALDFLRKVEVWQQAPGGTAGIAVLMPDREEATLEKILAEARKPGASRGWTEAWARNWLIGYREMNPPLTGNQRAELDQVIDRSAGLPYAQLGPRPGPRRAGLPGYRFGVIIGASMAALIILALLIGQLVSGSKPPAPVTGGGAAQQGQAQQQVPAGTTLLDNFKADWGPFTQLPVSEQDPQTGAPALLFCENGGYYTAKWSVPAADQVWSADLGGNIAAVDVHGNWALVTDADGNNWVVGTGQPFVIARNPTAVLRVDPAGTVLAIPESHAIAIRHHL